MTKQIRLEYFAVFRELRGVSEETLVSSAPNPRSLYAELGFSGEQSVDPHRLKVAINGEFAGWEDELRDGDTVVFLAPFSGG